MKFSKPVRPVTKVFIHCSASDHPCHDNIATMRQWHLQRGWSDVGYHIFCRRDGTAELGRSLEKTPAAQAGHNRGSIAICLHGLKKSRFTAAQKRFLVNICHQINDAYDGNVTFHGHNEVAAKACPVIDYRALLKLSPTGRLGIARPEPIDPADPAVPGELETSRDPASPTLRYGNKGRAVEQLQRDLNALGYHVGNVDGHFGKRTRGAVLAFQADNHLIEDGIVGAATWEALDDGEVREVCDTRKAAGLVSMAKGGSRIAQASIANTAIGTVLSSGGALTLLEETSGAVSKISDSLGPLKATIVSLGPWAGALVVLGGIFVVAQAQKAGRARVEDHRTGKTP